MPQKTLSTEMRFAIDICKSAGTIAMDHWRAGVVSSNKVDGTLVTIADQQCERLIREKIAQQFPSDGILGEEEAERESTGSGRRWIIDPIDGTYNYARGIPIFATLLALEHDGKIVLGVVHAPAMAETLWAERGGGAFKNGTRMQVSNCRQISQAMLSFGGLKPIMLSRYRDGFSKLVVESEKQRGFGDYLGYSVVFEGKAEAMFEVGIKPWDIAPMKILIEESGGKYSDLAGGDSIYKGDSLVSNRLIHDQIEKTLLAGA